MSRGWGLYDPFLFEDVGHRRREIARGPRRQPKPRTLEDDRWVAPRPHPKALKAGMPPYGKKVFLVQRAQGLPLNLIGTVPEHEEYERLRLARFSTSSDCIVIMRNVPRSIPWSVLCLS